MMSDKEYKELFPSGIPCKVEKSNISDIDEEIMLISANHDVRETSMEVKRWEISRLKELYEAKKLKGEIKNINAEIAKQLNISERQARKYTTAEKLIPELSELLNANGIDLNQADKFGKLDEGAQKSILELMNTENIDAEISRLQEENEALINLLQKSYTDLLEETSRQKAAIVELWQSIELILNIITDKYKDNADIAEQLKLLNQKITNYYFVENDKQPNNG